MGRMNRRRSSFGWDDDSKPMDGVANLSDAMLVFACGLMTAIAVNWNVDLHVQQVDVEQQRVVTETELNNAASEKSDEDAYQEMGTVYKDPETGEMYLVSD